MRGTLYTVRFEGLPDGTTPEFLAAASNIPRVVKENQRRLLLPPGLTFGTIRGNGERVVGVFLRSGNGVTVALNKGAK